MYNSSDSPGISSCRPGWPRTHRDRPAPASQVVGLKACTTTAQLEKFLDYSHSPAPKAPLTSVGDEQQKLQEAPYKEAHYTQSLLYGLVSEADITKTLEEKALVLTTILCLIGCVAFSNSLTLVL